MTIFDLPRLSVDIDMDFSKNVPREVMLKEREQIDDHIRKYMAVGSGLIKHPFKLYQDLEGIK